MPPSTKFALTAASRCRSAPTWSSSSPSRTLDATSAKPGRRSAPGDGAAEGPNGREADDHDAVGTQCERRLERRVQPRPAVDEVAGALDLDGREDERDGGAGAHVVDAKRDGLVGEVVPRPDGRQRLAGVHEGDGAAALERRGHGADRVDVPAGDVAMHAVEVDPLPQRPRQRRRVQQPGRPAERQPQHARRPAGHLHERRRPEDAPDDLPTLEARPAPAQRLGLRGRVLVRQRGQHGRVDRADARPAQDDRLLPALLEERQQHGEGTGLICASRPTPR